MSSLNIVGGCVLVNDILKTNKFNGSGKDTYSNIFNRFKDLAIPVGFSLTNPKKHVKNTNNNRNNEQPYVNGGIFDIFIKNIT